MSESPAIPASHAAPRAAADASGWQRLRGRVHGLLEPAARGDRASLAGDVLLIALPTGIFASACTEQQRLRADELRRRSETACSDGVQTAGRIPSSEQLRAMQKTAAGRCPHCGRPPGDPR